MMYILGITAALLFTVGAIFLPRTLINFYAHEASVIDYGAGYLSIVGISYVPTVIGFALSVVCRSTGNMKLPTFTSVLSMMINIVGNAILIFGLLGAPALGVNGAAIATVIARTVECAVLVFFIYRHKMAGAATFRELFCFDRMFVRRYVKTTAPVLINETLWSIGTSLYSVAFGLLGTNAVAAVQIANTIAQMLLVFVRGAGNAAAIMIGNKIGAGKEEEAFADSKRFMILMLVIGSVVCVAVILLRPLILSIYNVSDETLQFANELLLLHGLTTIPDSINMLVIVGVCRSGGDTKFACLLDTLSVWLLGMPLGFLGVYLGFPLWAVFLCVSTEKIAKPILGIPRVYSKKSGSTTSSRTYRENQNEYRLLHPLSARLPCQPHCRRNRILRNGRYAAGRARCAAFLGRALSFRHARLRRRFLFRLFPAVCVLSERSDFRRRIGIADFHTAPMRNLL